MDKNSLPQFTPAILYLLTAQEALRRASPVEMKPGERIHVSEAISKVSALYEYLRQSAEYTEEHLILRNVIERILKRRLFIQLQKEPFELAEGLLHELISGAYLPNDAIHVDTQGDFGKILVRYLTIFDAIPDRPSEFNDFLLQLASVELERMLNIESREKEEAFAHFAFMIMRDQIIWPRDFTTSKEHELQLYIATLRTCFKYDDAQISFSIFRSIQGGWSTMNREEASAHAHEILGFWKGIQQWLLHPWRENYVRAARQLNPAFLIVSDVFAEHPNKAQEVFADPERLSRALQAAAQARYATVRGRLRHKARRATIYIFITKMLLALGIEVPYDIFLAANFAPFPLVINLVFPPALMFLMGATTPLPSKSNTERIKKDIMKIVYATDARREPLRTVEAPKPRSIIQTALFSFLLAGLFVLSFGIFIGLLTVLKFSVVSGAVFMFFLTVVSLFAYRIRKPVAELFVKQVEGGVATVLFLLTYPLVVVGHVLSDGAAKVNIPVIILDIFIEAPLKSFLEVGENWLAFLREKQEEIV